MTTSTGRPIKVGIQLPEVERDVRWPELLDMTRAIEDLGFDSVWVGEHLLYRWEDRPPRGPWEAWTLLAGHRRVDDADRARAARRLHELPQPGAPRQAGRDDRRDQRRPLRARPRRRLERDRVPRLRLPVRPPGRPLRGGVHDHPDAPARGRHRLRRALVPGPRLRAPAARSAPRRPAADDRVERGRGCSGATMAHVDSWNAWYNAIENRPGGVPPVRDLVDEACREVGRDPAEVERTVAVLVRMPGGAGRVQGEVTAAGRIAAQCPASPPSWPRRCAPSRARGSPTSSSWSTRSPLGSIQALAPVIAALDRGA